MKFSCEKLLLLSAIMTALRAVASKSPVSLLEGLLLEALDGKVRVTGYDLKMAIVTTVPADVESTGKVVLNARLFGEIIRKMPGQHVSFSMDSDLSAMIVSEMSEFEILCSPASDYPELPVVQEDNSIEISQATLKKMISQTNFAVSDNESRPIHTGALFETGGGELTIVAVDGYRLALRREPMENDVGSYNFVVPGTALSEVEKIASDGDDDQVTITLAERHIMFSFADTVLITRRLEGEFLNYKNSVPASSTYSLRVEKSELIDSVERVSLIISDKLKSPVRCVFGDGVLKLYSMSALGKASDECAITGSGDDLEIGFNDKYFLEALKAAPAHEVNINLTTGVTPCVIAPVDGGNNFLYMILPVRLKAYEN